MDWNKLKPGMRFFDTAYGHTQSFQEYIRILEIDPPKVAFFTIRITPSWINVHNRIVTGVDRWQKVYKKFRHKKNP